MTRSLSRTFCFALLSVVGLSLSPGCDRNDTPVAQAPSAPSDTLPAGLVVTETPKEARTVTELKESAKEGDEVVLRARVGGTKEPMSPNRAVLTVIDSSVRTCDKMEGDHCATPWDACCEPAESRIPKSATVQVSGPNGQPLKVGLGGPTGIVPNKEVVVAGKVKTLADAKDGKTLVVDASRIYVVP